MYILMFTLMSTRQQMKESGACIVNRKEEASKHPVGRVAVTMWAFQGYHKYLGECPGGLSRGCGVQQADAQDCELPKAVLPPTSNPNHILQSSHLCIDLILKPRL